MADTVLVTEDLRPYLDSVESYLDRESGPAAEQSGGQSADSKLSDAGDGADKPNGSQQNRGEGRGKGHSNGSVKKNGT